MQEKIKFGNTMTKTELKLYREEAYKESKYIAEYYNTLSGAFYIIVGLPFLNTKINNIALASIFLGIGTMLLHMTQRKYGQILDESAMICLCYSILCKTRKIYKKKYITPLLIFYFLNHDNFIIFFILFTIIILLITFESLKLEENPKNKVYRNIFISNMIIGLICWLLDQLCCKYIQEYQLHAIWHMTTGISIYSGLSILQG